MKNLATLATALVLAAGCQDHSTTTSESATPVAFNALGAPTVSFSVPDMMCEVSCVATVKEALGSLPGVKEVEVDFEAKRATVAVDQDKFDSDVAIATLIDYQFTNSQLIEDGGQHVVAAKAQALGEDESPAAKGAH